ncbi:MAG: hypothetical protein KAQ94_02745 [Arcobacteraceae bacterium]|nr:hypothetical protein [Arcobacteraceae bacterium]
MKNDLEFLRGLIYKSRPLFRYLLILIYSVLPAFIIYLIVLFYQEEFNISERYLHLTTLGFYVFFCFYYEISTRIKRKNRGYSNDISLFGLPERNKLKDYENLKKLNEEK